MCGLPKAQKIGHGNYKSPLSETAQNVRVGYICGLDITDPKSDFKYRTLLGTKRLETLASWRIFFSAKLIFSTFSAENTS